MQMVDSDSDKLVSSPGRCRQVSVAARVIRFAMKLSCQVKIYAPSSEVSNKRLFPQAGLRERRISSLVVPNP